MKNKSHYLLILLLTIVISFPSICYSELKTVEGEYCDVYLGNLENKQELDAVIKKGRNYSTLNGLEKHIRERDPSKYSIHTNCYSYIVSNYLEKVVVVSHTEKGRKICDKVAITFDPEAVDKYFRENNCIVQFDLDWKDDIDNILTKKSDKINIGIIIETKNKKLGWLQKKQLENEEKKQFSLMTQLDKNKDKYKEVDRKNLSKVMQEQKISSSGITDNEIVTLGKMLKLDIIILRLIYENSRVTKVLKIDTGKVLLFKTYETEE